MQTAFHNFLLTVRAKLVIYRLAATFLDSISGGFRSDFFSFNWDYLHAKTEQSLQGMVLQGKK